MNDPREIIAILRELNATDDRNVGYFTPGLVGMFGSIALMNDFLADLDEALSSQTISPSLKSRASNLTRTFIPQVAALNSISDLSKQEISVEKLREIRTTPPEARSAGVKQILAALSSVCSKSCEIAG